MDSFDFDKPVTWCLKHQTVPGINVVQYRDSILKLWSQPQHMWHGDLPESWHWSALNNDLLPDGAEVLHLQYFHSQGLSNLPPIEQFINACKLNIPRREEYLQAYQYLPELNPDLYDYAQVVCGHQPKKMTPQLEKLILLCHSCPSPMGMDVETLRRRKIIYQVGYYPFPFD